MTELKHISEIEGLSPSPRPGFETDMLQLIRTLVDESPMGTATLRIRRVPEHPEWSVPYFEIIPSNARAAPLIGIAVHDDLNLTIGDVEREFAGFGKGGNIARGTDWQTEFRWIWKAVVEGGFSQRQAVGSNGQVIGGISKIPLNGNSWIFRGGKRAETFFRIPKYRTVVYEPYKAPLTL